MNTSHTILAFDPGLRELGYAVTRGKRWVTGGVLPLQGLPRQSRLRAAAEFAGALIEQHGPDALVVERTHKHPLPWLNDLERLTRRIHRLAIARKLPFASYAPQSVRKQLLGNGWASKAEVAAALASRYHPLRVYLTQDKRWKERYWQNMFDALALALHHRSIQ